MHTERCPATAPLASLSPPTTASITAAATPALVPSVPSPVRGMGAPGAAAGGGGRRRSGVGGSAYGCRPFCITCARNKEDATSAARAGARPPSPAPFPPPPRPPPPGSASPRPRGAPRRPGGLCRGAGREGRHALCMGGLDMAALMTNPFRHPPPPLKTDGKRTQPGQTPPRRPPARASTRSPNASTAAAWPPPARCAGRGGRRGAPERAGGHTLRRCAAIRKKCFTPLSFLLQFPRTRIFRARRRRRRLVPLLPLPRRCARFPLPRRPFDSHTRTRVTRVSQRGRWSSVCLGVTSFAPTLVFAAPALPSRRFSPTFCTA